MTRTMSPSATSWPPHFSKGLFRRLGEAKIGDAGEALLHAVIAIGGQQLQRANNAQLVEQIAADLVLAAFAAIERQLQHADAVAARFQRQHAAIFVVGMSDGVHQPRRGVQPPQHQLQPGGAGIDSKRLGIHPGRWDLGAAAVAATAGAGTQPAHR